MASRSPRSLQSCAARSLARSLVHNTEERVRSAINLVPAELLIARATADLIVRKDEEGHDGDFDSEDEEASGDGDGVKLGSMDDMDIMDYAMLQVKSSVCSVRVWVKAIPGVKSGPRERLFSSLTEVTEVHPRHQNDFPRQLVTLLLRLAVLPDVFLDPDYSDQDRRCLVPFAWERWVARLVARLAPFHQLQQLRVYGGLYPSILAAVLRGSHNLTDLYISHINITDNLLLTVGRCCPRLNSLFLLHNFPWQVISTHAFYASFFSGATRQEITRSMRGNCNNTVKLSFPALRELELAYGDHEVAREFHRVIVALYHGVVTLTCPWKTNIFEDGYGNHSSLVLLPVLPLPTLSLETLYLDTPTLASLSPPLMHKLTQSCPQVTSITLDCELSASTSLCEAAGSRLKQLSSSWPNMKRLHVNVNEEDHLSRAVLQPTLTTQGVALTTLTLEAAAPDQRMQVATVIHCLKLCPNLQSLSIRVWSKSQVTAHLDQQGCIVIPSCLALHCFSLHEDGPGDEDDPESETGHVASWSALLCGMVAAASNLTTLSISMCRGLESLLKKITCDVTSLHLHVNDPLDWQPTTEQLVGMVGRLPALHHLYLEEISGRIFWKLRRHFLLTDLHLYWGNLYGWPRT